MVVSYSVQSNEAKTFGLESPVPVAPWVISRPTGLPAPHLQIPVPSDPNTRGSILTCSMWGNVIRSRYPLTTPAAVLGEGLKILEETMVGVYALANLRVGVSIGSDWAVSLFCNNLANPDFNRVLTAQPRTIGLDFNFKH
jgi:hypothetical protein